jgi:hypothetical protein
MGHNVFLLMLFKKKIKQRLTSRRSFFLIVDDTIQ